MISQTQMFDHALDYLKGWPSPTAVDFAAKMEPTLDATVFPFFGGRVVHLNAAGNFEPGAKLGQMPIFTIQASNDYDVASPAGTAWYAIAPKGIMSGLVAIGGYELETTEYDQTAGVTYAPNDYLHAPTVDQINTASKALAGTLYKAMTWPGGNAGALVPGHDNICGVVSRGAHLNANRKNVLSFWPVYVPGSTN